MSNLVSAEVSNEVRDSAKTKIDEIAQSLPFLIALSSDKKSRKRVMGQKSVEYVNLALRGLNNFPKYLPQAFDKEELAKDVNLVSQLWEVRVPLAALLERIDDTIFAASADAMVTADEIYRYLKAAARKDASVKALVDEMAKRYSKQAVKKEEKPNT